MNTLIELRNIKKTYKSGKQITEALKDVSFSIYPGEIIALLGINGAGKTTLSSILSALHAPTSGEFLFNNQSVYNDLNAYKQTIGLCQQKPNLDTDLTVYENLLFAGRYYLINEQQLRMRIEDVLKEFDLTHYRDFHIDHLSGGYRQRVMIARAIIHKPTIVILDEPTVGLDPNVRRQIWQTIAHLRQQGTTVILTTHYLDEAEFLSDRVVILHNGKILLIDKAEHLKQNYQKSNLEEVFLHLMNQESI